MTAGPGARWAADSLDRALSHACLLGLAAWQLAVGVLVAGRTPEHRPTLLVLHLAVAAVSVPAVLAAARRPQTARAAFFVVLFAGLVTDLGLTDDALAATVVGLTFLVAATPFLVLRWPVALAVSAPAILVASWVGHDRFGGSTALALGVPSTFYALSAWAIMTILRRFAAAVDDADEAAAAEHARLVAARASARTAADFARALHDTAVNTLAAIAAGGHAVADEGHVRARCAQDVATLRALGAGEPRASSPLERAGDGLALAVQWTGLIGPALHDRVERLGAARRDALSGIVRELLINVEKHAGTGRATVAVHAAGDGLRVVVTDDGPGRDPRPADRPAPVQSVERRAAEAGIGLRVSTPRGGGTEVRLDCPASSADDVDETDATRVPGHDQRAAGIRRTATWAWAGLVSVAGLVITVVGTPTPASLGSAGLVAVVSLACWWWCRDGADLPLPAALAVAAGVPAGFVLGFVGAAAIGGDPAFWPVIGLTPLLVVLLNVVRSTLPLALAVVALAAVAVGCATSGWDADHRVAGTAIANACIQVAQLVQWLIFVGVLNDITTRSEQARRQGLHDRAERAALETARRTRDRWRDAQLDLTLDLLRDIADGRRSPHDPQTQALAGREEHALRQLLLLDPDLVHLGPWLARTIGHTRRHDVRMTVRAGAADLPDPHAADVVGSALEELVAGVAPGTDLTVAYFGDRSGAHVTVVGPRGFCDRIDTDSPVARRVTHLHVQDLVELEPAVRVTA